MRVVLGSERLLESGTLDGRRVGIVCNPASIDGEFRHVADRLAADARVRLAALFGPQHGFRSDVQENMIETGHGRDEIRRVPVYSLYSETREPTAEMLRDLDVLVIDLQDVGTRIYTYIYTMANCLRAARRHGVKVIVCDRPNPIGGIAVEGPMLERGFESFVGLYPIPMRHGMTIGELARLFNEHFGIGAELEVVTMGGWRREHVFGRDGPAVGAAVAEHPDGRQRRRLSGHRAVRRNERLGRTRHDAPVRARRRAVDRRPKPFADAMNRLELPGVHFRPAVFEPTFHKHAKTSCGGCQIHVLDREAFRAGRNRRRAPRRVSRRRSERFEWREPPYEYEHEKLPIDILAGSSELREQIEAGVPAREIARSWEKGCGGVRRRSGDGFCCIEPRSSLARAT